MIVSEEEEQNVLIVNKIYACFFFIKEVSQPCFIFFLTIYIHVQR